MDEVHAGTAPAPVSATEPAAASSPAAPPFFVLGCPRSGTSLLSRILNMHSALAIPRETQIFSQFYPLRECYGDLSHPSALLQLIEDIAGSVRMREDFKGRITPTLVLQNLPEKSFGGVFAGFLKSWAALQGKTCWGEKTPQNAHVIDALAHYFPQARYIHLLRDGRDVALSLRDTRFGPKTIESAARYWRYFVERNEAARAQVSADNWLEIHYEALLANPEQVLTRICNFLGVEFEPALMRFHEDALEGVVETRNAVNLTKTLQTDNREKWRSRLDPDEITRFEAIAEEALHRYGYPVLSSAAQRADIDQERAGLQAGGRRLRGMVENRRAQQELLYRVRCGLSAWLRSRLAWRNV